MTRIRRLIVVPLTAALLLGAAPALTGCSFQTVVKDVTGGNVDIGGDKVPSDFPHEVPLAPGKVLLGASVGSGHGKVWNVTVSVSGADAAQQIEQQLTDAGFQGAFRTEQTGSACTFTDGTYGVLVVVTDSGDKGWVANYSVSKAAVETATPTP